MARGLSWADWPRKNAVLMSKDDNSQPLLAMVWRTVCLPSRVNVGESRATSQSFGSWKPRTTKRALAFLWGFWLSSSLIFFHVRIHRLFRICSGLRWRLKIGFSALVCIQQFNSASFAFSNCIFSSSVKFFTQTSAFALFPTLATHAISSGFSAADHFRTSDSDRSMDKAKHCCSSHARGVSSIGRPSSANNTACPEWLLCKIVQSYKMSPSESSATELHCKMGMASAAAACGLLSSGSRSMGSSGTASGKSWFSFSVESGAGNSWLGSGNVSLSGCVEEWGVASWLGGFRKIPSLGAILASYSRDSAGVAGALWVSSTVGNSGTQICDDPWTELHSRSDAGRMLSGAHLNNLSAWDNQTADGLSWWITRAGPCHRPVSCRLVRCLRIQYMTSWPGVYGPRMGQDLRKRALRMAWSLSVKRKALRAWVLISKDLRKNSLSGSFPMASKCEAALSSEVKLAGSFWDFPSTICSGENPPLRVSEFLAWKQDISTRSKSCNVSMDCSWSQRDSMRLITWPCRSRRPRCQASVDIKGSMSWFLKSSVHSFEMNSPAGSV